MSSNTLHVLVVLCFYHMMMVYSLFSNFSFDEITEDDILQLRDELITEFDASGTRHPLIGKTVRLIFHDCAGFPENNTEGIISICDGCIALNASDNLGLETEVIDILDDIYVNSMNSWSTKMSTADFWAAAATIAIQYAQFLDDTDDILPFIPYYFGRDECSTTPHINKDITAIKPMPSGSNGWEDSFEWFSDNFGLNIEETVALIGAHTLGKAHPSVSGFDGPWVVNWDVFNNEFYVDLINNDWEQVTVPSTGEIQWSDGDPFMMLNSDISLWKNIDQFLNESTGIVSCLFDNCTLNNDSASFVLQFVNSNQLFLDKFVDVFIKMITIGYDINDLLRLDVNISISLNTESTITPNLTDDGDDDDDGSFDFGEFLEEYWLYIVIAFVGLLILLIIIICCCKKLKQKQARNKRNVEMFGGTVDV